MYDIVFLSSSPYRTKKVRALGPYALIEEIEKIGMSALSLDFIDSWLMDDLKKVIDKAIGPDTKYLGISSTFAGGVLFVEKSDGVKVGNYILNGNLDRIIEWCKIKNPNIKILLGGSKSSILNKRVGDKVDHIFKGFSETQLIDFINNPDGYDRIIEHDKEAWAKHTGYDFAEANPKFPKHSFITPAEVMPIECARGCKFKCKFCAFPLIGMKDAAAYTKKKEKVRDQFMYNYETFGVQKYSIQDDTFNDSIDKVKMYAEVAQSLPFKLYFWCYIRADLLVTQPEQIPLLHEMGLTQTWMGIETYHREAGKVVGKGLDPNRIKDMLYKAKEVWKDDVFVNQGLIVGLPGENEASVRESVDWVCRDDTPIDMAMALPLQIRSNIWQKTQNDYYQSEFDRNYEQYGYSFPYITPETYGNPKKIKDYYRWVKDDGTDILTFDRAEELATELQPRLFEAAKSRGKRVSIFDSAYDFEHGYTQDQIRGLRGQEQKEFECLLNPSEDAYDSSIKKHYIDPLITYLYK